VGGSKGKRGRGGKERRERWEGGMGGREGRRERGKERGREGWKKKQRVSEATELRKGKVVKDTRKGYIGVQVCALRRIEYWNLPSSWGISWKRMAKPVLRPIPNPCEMAAPRAIPSAKL